MKRLIWMLAGLFLLLIAQPVLAVTYYLDETNDLSGLNSAPWGYVTLTQTTDTVHFKVAPIIAGFQGEFDNFGQQNFFFNYSGDPEVLSISNLTHPWDISFIEENLGGEFGKFTIQLAGTGSSRVTPTTPLEFDAVFAGLTIADFLPPAAISSEGYIFGAHIAGYDGGDQSAKFSTDGPPVVPEPGTMLLLGSGLVGLAGWGRKKLR